MQVLSSVCVLASSLSYLESDKRTLVALKTAGKAGDSTEAIQLHVVQMPSCCADILQSQQPVIVAL